MSWSLGRIISHLCGQATDLVVSPHKESAIQSSHVCSAVHPSLDQTNRSVKKMPCREIGGYNERIALQFDRQHGCRGACQIAERLEMFKHESRGFETSRDLAIRPLLESDVLVHEPAFLDMTRTACPRGRTYICNEPDTWCVCVWLLIWCPCNDNDLTQTSWAQVPF